MSEDPTTRKPTRPSRVCRVIEALPLKNPPRNREVTTTSTTPEPYYSPHVNSAKTWKPRVFKPKNNSSSSRPKTIPRRPPTPDCLKPHSPLELLEMAAPPKAVPSYAFLAEGTPPRQATPPPEEGQELPEFSEPPEFDFSNFLPFSEPPPAQDFPENVQYLLNQHRRLERYQTYKKQALSHGKKLLRGPLSNTKLLRNSRRANARRLRR